MLYNHSNVMPRTAIYDMDANERIDLVLEINTQAGWVKVASDPPQADTKGRIVGKRIHFRSVHAIRGDEPAPCLFHCYGRRK
ncbi:hypothetical protein [Paracidovorax avenae]|uniref:hypothetical protein n=1 Tax=Paracidovorax avenae TaxID=80867 RepID=UPI0006B36AE8|nr:hypothetical protein [Paracidovorax avenae]